MHILLTGSSGWLGRFLAPMLAAAGHRVTGLDHAPGAHTQIRASVADRPQIEALFAQHRFDAVIHAAALHKPDIARHTPQAFIDTNITGTQILLDAATANRASRFILTSTTSLMITAAIRAETGSAAVWLDEQSGPLEPRNIYGVTKRAAEDLCRLHHAETGLPILILRTARFFPEDDDTHRHLSGPNLKANEFLHRRLTVEDAARAHLLALDRAPALAFGTFILSAPTPFTRAEATALKSDAAAVITRHFPQAPALYAAQGWHLPTSIGRIYDSTHAERRLGFRCQTDFAAILSALAQGTPLPFAHDPTYTSPAQAGQHPIHHPSPSPRA